MRLSAWPAARKRVPPAPPQRERVTRAAHPLRPAPPRCSAVGDDLRWLPEVTLEFRDLRIEADALVGSASVPSVGQSAKGALKKLLCQVGAV